MTFSNNLSSKDEPAIALYDDTSEGSLTGDFKSGKKLYEKILEVILP